MNRKNTGLFFGSFNPIHVGHLIIATTMLNQTNLDEIWLVVSPHNPLKDKSTLANDYDRLYMVELALGDNLNIRASNVEFSLPKPSYTIDTLAHLEERYPQRNFHLIMGGDNIKTIQKWKNADKLLERSILVYQRQGQTWNEQEYPQNVIPVDAPLLDISSTFIRSQIKAGKSVRYLVTDAVNEYIESKNLYK